MTKFETIVPLVKSVLDGIVSEAYASDPHPDLNFDTTKGSNIEVRKRLGDLARRQSMESGLTPWIGALGGRSAGFDGGEWLFDFC